MKKVLILFSGEGTNLQRLIDTLPKAGIGIACAVTNRPKAGGVARAARAGIPVEIVDHTHFEGREAFDAALVKVIESHRPDLVVLAGFMRILTPVFTDRVRAINLHPSLLPKYKGARAIEHSYESGDARCGVSIHWVSGELDGGEVISQAAFEREPGMDFDAFSEKIRSLEHTLLPQTVISLLSEN